MLIASSISMLKFRLTCLPLFRFINTTWTSMEAPKVAVLAWDMTNIDDTLGDMEVTLPLECCSALRKNYVSKRTIHQKCGASFY